MYSQYNYYQAGAAPQQQQQPVASATGSQVWNGQQWVPAAMQPQPTPAAAAPISYAAAAAAPQVVKHGKTHAELVQLYTTYYHHWTAQAAQAKAALAGLPPPHPNTPSNNSKREEMERREKWATYYSSNSAALAHYHLSLSRQGGEPYARPASPPVPPQLENAAAAGGAGAPVASAAPAATAIQSSAPAVSATIGSASKATEKKKSRWASTSVQDEFNNGKSSAAAAAEKNASSKGSDLYNKFVQEGQSSKKLGSPQTNTSSGGVHAGMKRKMVDRYDSALSNNSSSYYGPTSTSSRGEEDYMPFGLDQPLGGGKAKTPSKKEKKKQKKAKQAAAEAAAMGFDSNASTLSERANRFKGKGGIHDVSSAPSSVANVEKYMGKTVIGGSRKQLDEHDYERMTVKGTCQTLEKEYLRLTSPPRAELVRPQPVLERHLANLKKSYKNGGNHNGRNRDYNWYCSQFKAIRQDLTVQRIINSFAVDVYETHAKIALEEDDINEYNQSQTQLKELYDLIPGKVDKKEVKKALKNRDEFVAYRIIYYVFLSGNKKYQGGSSDIFKIMLSLSPDQRKDECIHHALLVRAAVADNDYHKFFQLQDVAPNMGDYLMDKIVPSVRQGALQRMCKAYRPSVETKFVLKELGFDIKNKKEVAGGKSWLESCGCKFDGELLVTKDTVLKESVAGVKNSLI